MRIAVIGKFYPEAFGLHIVETLEAMGHTAVRCPVGRQAGTAAKLVGRLGDKILDVIYIQSDHLPRVRAWRFGRFLERLVGQGALDLVIATHDFLWPAEVAAIQQCTGAACVLWFPDCVANLGRGYLFNAPYDAVFFKDPFMVEKTRMALGERSFYLPECQNPRRHEAPEKGFPESELAPYRCDITVAGNIYSYRVAVFSQLADFDVKLWGNPPPAWLSSPAIGRMYQGRPVYYEEKTRAFHAAKIVLNSLYCAEVAGVNARTFEAAAAGAFQLVDWRPALPQLFEEGKEVVTFRNTADLQAKIRQHLHEDETRREIGRAGRQRARRDHTYQQRLQLLIDTVAGSAAGFPLTDAHYE